MLLERAFTEDNLYEAWQLVHARKAGLGVDGVTVFGFGRNLDRNLALLRRQLLGDDYHPDPVLRRYIPKSDGDFRRIGIPTVRDRIAQRALLNCLLEIVEPRLSDSSFAYRPKRSVRMAVARIESMRNQGAKWVARADIDLCFDSIPHGPLLSKIYDWVGEPQVIELIKRWLDAGYVDGTIVGKDDAGVPQGDVLSPVLSNIYLDAFDQSLASQGEQFVRYADDVLIACPDRQSACRAMAAAGQALNSLALKLDPQKSQILSFTGGFKYLGTLFVGSMAIPAVRIERADGSAVYVSGYGGPRRPELKLQHSEKHVKVLVEGGQGISDQQLARLVAKEVWFAKKGWDTAVGRALIEAWEESRESSEEIEETTQPGPSDWAYLA